MEYVSGMEVIDYVEKNGRMNEPVARRIFRQLISAVELLHRKNFVHR